MRSDAVLVVADPFLAGERVRIANEMIKNKLPSDCTCSGVLHALLSHKFVRRGVRPWRRTGRA
jgi:hypothetical protein